MDGIIIFIGQVAGAGIGYIILFFILACIPPLKRLPSAYWVPFVLGSIFAIVSAINSTMTRGSPLLAATAALLLGISYTNISILRVGKNRAMNAVAYGGHVAFHSGLGIDENPHNSNSQNHDFWRRGYVAAREKAEKQDGVSMRKDVDPFMRRYDRPMSKEWGIVSRKPSDVGTTEKPAINAPPAKNTNGTTINKRVTDGFMDWIARAPRILSISVAVLIIGMLLFPPFVTHLEVRVGTGGEMWVGYHFIFSPPGQWTDSGGVLHYPCTIDTPLLAIQIVGVTLAAGVLFFGLRRR